MARFKLSVLMLSVIVPTAAHAWSPSVGDYVVTQVVCDGVGLAYYTKNEITEFKYGTYTLTKTMWNKGEPPYSVNKPEYLTKEQFKRRTKSPIYENCRKYGGKYETINTPAGRISTCKMDYGDGYFMWWANGLPLVSGLAKHQEYYSYRRCVDTVIEVND